MESTSAVRRSGVLTSPGSIDWNGVFVWLLGFGSIVGLGLDGGGYDPLVHGQFGIAIWWVVLAGLLVGALPRGAVSPVAWLALGLLGGLTAWTALSLGWSESVDKTGADLARVAGYLGVLALAVMLRGPRGGRRMVAAVATGITAIAVIALLSRLHPSWFQSAGETAAFLSGARSRLSYPLDYWNGLAALIAIGLPLMLHVATSARSVVFRALAAAALPAMFLTCFLTLSRGGAIAGSAALFLYLALAPDRVPRLLTLVVSGSGGAILIAAANQREPLTDGLVSAAARQDGNEILAMTLVVCAGVALIQAGLSIALATGMRPGWSHLSRRHAITMTAVAATFAVIAMAAFDLPGRAGDAWSDFKDSGSTSDAVSRYESFRGNGRYQYWASAVRQSETDSVKGTGSGTFELWRARNGDGPGYVRDTHSLYLQTLGELGIVGLALLGGFMLVVLGAGARITLRTSPKQRSQVAAALAGCLAFCLSAVVDWTWQLPVIPIAFMLLASVLLTADGRRSRKAGLPWGPRAGLAIAAIAAIVAIAIPLSSASLLRESQAEASGGDYEAALAAARTAQDVQPGAAAPHLQEALLLEATGQLQEAGMAGKAATDKEPLNWKNWLVLSRLQAKQGKSVAAVTSYRKARSLNPDSPLFEGKPR